MTFPRADDQVSQGEERTNMKNLLIKVLAVTVLGSICNAGEASAQTTDKAAEWCSYTHGHQDPHCYPTEEECLGSIKFYSTCRLTERNAAGKFMDNLFIGIGGVWAWAAGKDEASIQRKKKQQEEMERVIELSCRSNSVTYAQTAACIELSHIGR
jgi:hypothetical protein